MKNLTDMKVLLAFCAFDLSQGLACAAPIDALLAAIVAEETAPAVRVRLFVKRGDVADVYFTDRIRPGRLRVMKNPRQNGLEIIVVENQQWLGTPSGWKAAPTPGTTVQAALSLTALLKNGLTGVAEQADADGGRIIEGEISWSVSTTCRGKLRVHIEPSGRPVLLGFEGECASKPTIFRQAMSYGGGFTIDPPN